MSDHAANLHSDVTYNHAAAHADMFKFGALASIPLAPPAGNSNPNPYPNLHSNPNPNPILIPILTRSCLLST
jgi:hypothetical protein